jgi:hypothetical protein
MKMECSETSGYTIQMPGNYTDESIVIISYRRSGQLIGPFSKRIRGLFTLEDGNDKLSLNVDKELPLVVA